MVCKLSPKWPYLLSKALCLAAKVKSVSAFCLYGLVLALSSCASSGTEPGKEAIDKFKRSKQFNSEAEIFENRRPNIQEELKNNVGVGKVFKKILWGGVDRSPKDKLPEEKPNLSQFLKNDNELKVIWFGHSSFLLNMDGNIILVDPVFSSSASPISFMARRFQKPVLNLKDLPSIDYVLISHDHYDHLDMESIVFFKDKKATFVMPLGVGSHLKGWGISANRIIEKDWWEGITLQGIEFIATPAQHSSGRLPFLRNKTLWASWVLKTESHKIYFSGDSGYDIHFKEIGEKYGPFDVAFIETGQYHENFRAGHMFPNEGAMAYRDLKAEKYFPVHWGMFQLALHSWYDPIQKLFSLSKEMDIDLLAPKLGQIVNIKQPQTIEIWWE